MNTTKIVQDYYGAKYFIEVNKHRDLTIFIVDDSKLYLKLLKNSLKRPNFSVFTFTSGEECMEYLSLKPDFIILDYHLDGVNPHALKGDKIYDMIKAELHNVEIAMISSDEKFQLISGLHLTQAKQIIYKDGMIIPKLKEGVNKLWTRKVDRRLIKKIMIYLTLGVSLFFILMYYLFK